MKKFISSSEIQTKEIAKKFSKTISSGTIALSGSLGAGKTVFVNGFAQGLGIEDKIISPTFVLIKQYNIPKSQKKLFHIDLYRLPKNPNIKQLGLSEILLNKENIILIEWAEKIKDLLPSKSIWIYLENTGKRKRKITITD